MEEHMIWKSAAGWEGFYEVSACGRVRSILRQTRVNRLHEGTRTMGGKLLSVSIDRHGYHHVHLSGNKKIQIVRVHRLVLQTFKPTAHKNLVCRHLNGDKTDNNIGNLEWGSHKDNADDRTLHNRTALGELHGRSKITNADALYIYNSDEFGSTLANRFGVNKSKISDIRRGRTYKSITGGTPKPARKANQYGKSKRHEV